MYIGKWFINHPPSGRVYRVYTAEQIRYTPSLVSPVAAVREKQNNYVDDDNNNSLSTD